MLETDMNEITVMTTTTEIQNDSLSITEINFRKTEEDTMTDFGSHRWHNFQRIEKYTSIKIFSKVFNI